MECSYMVPSRGVAKSDECVFPEFFVETVMDDGQEEPSSSKLLIDVKTEPEINITEVKKLSKGRPFFSRVLLSESKEDLKPKKIEPPKDKLPIEDLLEDTQNLKQLFQDVYYKNISKDIFLKELCNEKNVSEEFPFKSKTLNEYLQNNAKLNISFEIPSLYAYEKPHSSRSKPIIDDFVTIKRITAPSTSVKKPEQVRKLRIPFDLKRKTDFDSKQKDRRHSVEAKKCFKAKLVESQPSKYSNKVVKTESIYSDDERLLMSKFNLSKIPYVYKCARKGGKRCCDPPTKFRLGLVLNVGYKRPIPQEQNAILNFDDNETLIDPTKAAIAVSAVTSFRDTKLTRLIVPVVPDTDVFSKSIQALKLSKVSFHDSSEIKGNVEKTVQDLVDFVVRQEDFLPIEFDADSSYSADVSKKGENETECLKEYCIKGCVCDSLKGKVESKHCDSIDCVFGCVCNELRRRTLRNAQLDEKEEIMVNGKIRRGSKVPQRYRDYVRNFSLVNPMKSLDNKKHDADFKINLPPPKKIKLEPVDKKRAPKLLGDSEVAGMEWEILRPVKEQILDRRFKFCTGKMKERQSLGDIFIWCTIHSKYNCLCPNPVIMLKNNIVVWKPTSEARYLANKVMFKIFLDNAATFDKEAVPVDLQGECSRTFKGLCNDYYLRNSDPIFQRKRKYELDNKIICYSNSYIKCKPYLMLDKSWTSTPLPYEQSPCVSPNMKIVNIHSKKGQKQPDFVDVEELSEEMDVFMDDDSVISIPEMNGDVVDVSDENESESLKTDEPPKKPGESPKLKSKTPSPKGKADKPNSPGNVKAKLLEKESFNEVETDSVKFPSHGFLCLTPGIGFLEVDNSNNQIKIQHPKTLSSVKTFNSIEEANEWINLLFKKHFIFDPPNTTLQWVVVTQGILKLKKSKPFQTQLFNNPSVVITKNGPIIKKGTEKPQKDL